MTPWQARRRRRIFALWGPLLLISASSFVIAVLLWRHIEHSSSPAERFNRALTNEENDVAEHVAWEMVQSHPSNVDWWIRFTEAHADVSDDSEEDRAVSTISERAVRQQLAQAREAQTITIVSYWYTMRMKSGDADPSPVIRLADARPPAPFANYVLARAALEKGDWRTGASRFERDGLARGAEGERSLHRALLIWAAHDNWTDVRTRIDDRRYARAVDAALRIDLAIHDRNWLGVLLWCWPASYVDVSAQPVVLALIAAVLWFWIASRLGRVHDAVKGRTLLYAASFVLGVLSIYPTLLAVTIEESFGLRELGQFVPDLIFFIFGVGLREEASKFILFVPLLPALLRRGSRIEAMTCGALVGLGFAAEENVSHFANYGAGIALQRFLTANFLHMSLTALVALSAFDTLRKRATPRDAFNVVFPLAVAIHGAYDFCLTTQDMPLSSIFSIVLLIVIAQRFLRQLLIASSREDERDVLNLFVASMATISGAAYVYATTIAGPTTAFRMIAVGTLSVAVVIIMFVRELSGT